MTRDIYLDEETGRLVCPILPKDGAPTVKGVPRVSMFEHDVLVHSMLTSASYIYNGEGEGGIMVHPKTLVLSEDLRGKRVTGSEYIAWIHHWLQASERFAPLPVEEA